MNQGWDDKGRDGVGLVVYNIHIDLGLFAYKYHPCTFCMVNSI